MTKKMRPLQAIFFMFYTPLFGGCFEIVPIIFTVHKSLLGLGLSTGTSCRLIVRALENQLCVKYFYTAF